jgi:hypothetical protein
MNTSLTALTETEIDLVAGGYTYSYGSISVNVPINVAVAIPVQVNTAVFSSGNQGGYQSINLSQYIKN